LRHAHDQVHSYDLKIDHALDKFIKERQLGVIKNDVVTNEINGSGTGNKINKTQSKELIGEIKSNSITKGDQQLNSINSDIKDNKHNIQSELNISKKPTIVPNLNLNDNVNSIADQIIHDSAKDTAKDSAKDTAKDSAKIVTISKDNITPHISTVKKISTPKVETVKEKDDPFEDSLNNNLDDPFASGTKTKDDKDVFNNW